MNTAGQLHVGGSCIGSKPQATESFHPIGGMGSASPGFAGTTNVVSSHRSPSWLAARLPLAFRFIKFCLVGGTGVLVDMGILFLLADSRILGLNISFSKICAAEIALINNFIWNELWTFRQIPSPQGERARGEVDTSSGVRHSTLGFRRGLARRFLLFNAICGIGIGLAVFLLHLFHTWLGWNLYLSNLLAILLVTCWNFGLNSTLNWRDCGMALGEQKKTTMKG